jgi:glycolate oxidase iron-sulfur subunit
LGTSNTAWPDLGRNPKGRGCFSAKSGCGTAGVIRTGMADRPVFACLPYLKQLMQTRLSADLLATANGRRADEILRKCVHCGFCTATCPTYQLLGNELDGPRGRIYQIKQLFEGQPVDRETQLHLDRCLTCRSCETTCPSGVDYAELLDIGRAHIEQLEIRPFHEQWSRAALGYLLPNPATNRWLFKAANWLRPLLPASLKQKAPRIRHQKKYRSAYSHMDKTVLLLEGCVQTTLSPNTNAAAAAVLQSLGYRVIREKPVSCCGAVNHHLSQQQQTEQLIKHNLQQWQHLHRQTPLDAIVSTASGCGAMLKDYPRLVKEMGMESTQNDEILGKIHDISELLDAAKLRHHVRGFNANERLLAYHAPCTLSHGHHLAEHLFQQLTMLGYRVEKPLDAHLCCGSAGTYSLLQAEISRQLRDNKLDALLATGANTIITANVGCEHQLDCVSEVPVIHWVEQLAEDINRSLQP